VKPKTLRGAVNLQLVGIVLLLISIGTIVGPVGAVVVMYSANLPELVIPVELTNGNSTIAQLINGIGNNNTSDQNSFLRPVFVGAEVDNVGRTFTVTINFTNTLGFDLTLNTLSAGIVCPKHNFQVGNVSINSPVTLVSGETTQITVSGLWTQDAENHFTTQHAGQTSINIDLVNLTLDVNGITVHQTEPVNISGVPLNQ
jgi:hypothetical protein